MRRLLSLIVWLALAMAPLGSYAWSLTGHRTVALIAEANLTPAARNDINRLLAQEPGSTLESISTWADENRDSSNTRWHYVNFPQDACHYVLPRDCPEGQCVIAAIEKQAAIFHSHAPDTERLLALKFLVHLVGDIHQPLHAGFGSDRGGNLYQIQFQDEGSNLHALWDYAMVEQFGKNPASLSRLIMNDATIKKQPRIQVSQPLQNTEVESWAEQSCHIVTTPGFYPGRRVTDQYLKEFAPVTELQLWRAGMRLAAVLN